MEQDRLETFMTHVIGASRSITKIKARGMSNYNLGSTHTAARSTGTMNVVRRNDFFFTRTRYSRDMMVLMFLSFIAYASSVTSLMKISFILGTSSLNELTVRPCLSTAVRAWLLLTPFSSERTAV